MPVCHCKSSPWGPSPATGSHPAQDNEAIIAHTPELPELPIDPHTPSYLHLVPALDNRLGSLPMVAGGSIEAVPGYADALEQMTFAVMEAERFVDVEFHIAAWDRATSHFFNALFDATKRGVAS